MIARIWRGSTRLVDAQAYVAYLRQTGLAEYRQTPGNTGAWVLWREVGDEAEFMTLSYWESEEAIRRFCGDDIGRAVFYPEDERFLTRRDLRVEHFHLETPDSE